MERKGLFRQDHPLGTRPDACKTKPKLRSARDLLQAFGGVLRQTTSAKGGRGREESGLLAAQEPPATFPSETRRPASPPTRARCVAQREEASTRDSGPKPLQCSICLEPMLATDSCIDLGCFSQGTDDVSAGPSTRTKPRRVSQEGPPAASAGVPHRLHTVCLRQYVTFSLQNYQVSSSPARDDADPGAAILRCPLPDCRRAVPQSVIRRLLLSPAEDAAAACAEDLFLGERQHAEGASESVPLSTSTLASAVAARNRRETRKDDGSTTASWFSTPSSSDLGLEGNAPPPASSLAVAAAAVIRRSRRDASDCESVQKENQPQRCAAAPAQPTHRSGTETNKEGQELYGVYLQREFEAYADTAGDVVRCMDPDCGYAFWWPVDAEWPSDEAERRGGEPCPKCKRRCLICGAAAHEEASCEQAWAMQNPATCAPRLGASAKKGGGAGAGRVPRKKLCFWRELRRVDSAFEEYKKAENLRDCMQCGATVHLETGCHRMRCRCGYKFCYVCGTPNATCGCVEVQGHGFLSLEEVRQSTQPRRRAGSAEAEGSGASRDRNPAQWPATAHTPAPTAASRRGKREHVSLFEEPQTGARLGRPAPPGPRTPAAARHRRASETEKLGGRRRAESRGSSRSARVAKTNQKEESGENEGKAGRRRRAPSAAPDKELPARATKHARGAEAAPKRV
ncbi:conserved hypothetical protein [Neospora caninum Liverpool]|uniref:RBR-type E3 ubiquitin transferase n=1 Tax=Neospora caninum (strain Liverpool) TaxID=572307 RepID=F0VLW8_NEOCL|nr:conserved hypothetical protein [Neospora caninum Liverpool]CBZ54246.1 conserved hypothetical protein [Neospora caninum Liverpool]CEL68950.1 TPA: hypothetical protein BN1204_046780 [Neospora caninum Liverpool]|eukprot:XP_003884277.1 conserved hypothetical protein [Neospora caninum Liverpool]